MYATSKQQLQEVDYEIWLLCYLIIELLKKSTSKICYYRPGNKWTRGETFSSLKYGLIFRFWEASEVYDQSF